MSVQFLTRKSINMIEKKQKQKNGNKQKNPTHDHIIEAENGLDTEKRSRLP